MTPDDDPLFELPPEEFTTARNTLASKLKEEGRAEEAAEVKALKRPTLSVWAINQLARHEPERLAQLMEAASRLASLQRDVESGGGIDEFRDATKKRQELVAELTSDAKRLLEERGYSAGRNHLDRVTSTLLAAGADEETDDTLRRGVLTEDLTGGGLEQSFSFGQATDPGPPLKEDRRARKEAESLAQEAQEAEDAAAQLAKRAQQVQELADEAREEASLARKRAAEVRRKADEASRRLTEP